MTGFYRFAARPIVLVAALAAFIALGFDFGYVSAAIGGPLLDLVSGEAAAAARLAEMSAGERRVHIIATLTLDTAYPLSLLTFLAGLIYRFGPQPLARHLCLVPVAATLSDFAENALEVAALSGVTGLLGAKSLLTSVKFPLFAAAGVVALLCLLWGLGRALLRRRA